MTSMPQTHTPRVGRNALIVVAASAALLLIPAVAMRFTAEVNWTAFDFLVAFVLLSGFGLAYVLISSRMSKAAHRRIVAGGLFIALALLWGELATGYF